MPTASEQDERRKSSRPAILAGVLVLAGFAAAGVAAGMHTGAIQGQPPLGAPTMLAIGGALIGLAIVVAVIAAMRRHSRRAARVLATGQEALRSQGFEVDAKPDKTFHRRFKRVTRLTDGGKTTRAARGVIAGREAVLFEHSHTVHTGHATVTQVNNAWVVEAPQWPPVEIAPRGLFLKAVNRLGFMKGIMLDDEEFNRAFRVNSPDPDFAVTLLTPEVQRLLLEERGVVWRVGSGSLCVLQARAMNLDDIPNRAGRIDRFFRLVPPELL